MGYQETLWCRPLGFSGEAQHDGTPFSCAKFKGGPEADFAGYLSYSAFELRRWLAGWATEGRQSWVAVTRDLVEFLGRLNFVARVVVWIKPRAHLLLDPIVWRSILRVAGKGSGRQV